MPRAARIAIAHCPHHIIQRGHNRRAVFVTDGDRRSYLETLEEFRETLRLKVYSYCLMTNHVHLIVDPCSNAANVSLLMKRLAGRHTRRINRLERRTGTAWEGRFKCSPIESERYLLACSRYVDLNPVRAKMVAAPEDYLWSSYRAKVGLESCVWLDHDPCFLRLASDERQRREQYRNFVQQGIHDHELNFIRGAVQRNQLTGTDLFAYEIEQRTGLRIVNRERGRPRGE